MIKSVIFDLDGVLVTTDELHYKAWKQLADEEGIIGFTREDNIRQRGVSRMASLEVVLERQTGSIRTRKNLHLQSVKTVSMSLLLLNWTSLRYLAVHLNLLHF